MAELIAHVSIRIAKSGLGMWISMCGLLLCKHEDLSSSPRSPWEKLAVVTRLSVTVCLCCESWKNRGNAGHAGCCPGSRRVIDPVSKSKMGSDDAR